jgi:cytochrome bd-type quinol oxidase subunit 2
MNFKKIYLILFISLCLPVLAVFVFGSVHSVVLAQGGDSGPGGDNPSTLENPLGEDTTVVGILNAVAGFLFLVAVPIATIMILIGAFWLLTSGGNEQRITTGRKTITWAVIGFAVLILAGGIASIVANILGYEGEVPGVGNSPITDPNEIAPKLNTIAAWMFTVFLIIAVMAIIWSAFLYLTSGGNSEKTQKARKALIYAIVAIVIAVLAGGVPILIRNILRREAAAAPTTYQQLVDPTRELTRLY